MRDIIALVGLVLVRLSEVRVLVQSSITQGVHLMATVQELQAQVDRLIVSEANREARDIAQDAVTKAQIDTLQANLDALQAVVTAGGLSPADQAAIDAITLSVTGVIASLESADLTLPIVPAVV